MVTVFIYLSPQRVLAEFTASSIEKKSDLPSNPIEKLDEFDRWIKQQAKKKEQQSERILDSKEFQTKVFFGGWATFFTIVVVLDSQRQSLI